MAQVLSMPKFGQATEESTIVRWLKKEGDPIKKGEIIFEIETDKAVLEVESFQEGTLLKILVREGETVPVSAPVAFIGKPGEPLPAVPPPAPAPAAPTPAAPAKAAPAAAAAAPAPEPQKVAPAAAPKPEPQPAAPAPTPARPAPPLPPPPAARVVISPRARALAEQCAINAANIRGTGPNGRIREKDVRAYLAASGYDQLRISPAAKRLAIQEKIDILTVRGSGAGGRIMVSDVERIIAERPKAMSRMRQVIAQRLTQSFTTTPHFYVTVSVDMTNLLAFRQQLKAQGQEYTVTDFILEAVVLALKEFPTVNSTTDGRTIRWHSGVHLGVAVSLDEGLVVPVIRYAEELTLRELHDAAANLAAKARSGKLLPDEMSGSTFTVSNMGMMDVENFSAIINPGESAILAVSSTRQTPVALNGKVQIRAMMKITLSTDHRIIDGALGARFANAIKTKLEDMELWKSLT